MDICERAQGDLKELKRRACKEKGADQRDRRRAVPLALDGEEVSTIARLLRVTTATVSITPGKSYTNTSEIRSVRLWFTRQPSCRSSAVKVGHIHLGQLMADRLR